ncbi:MAG: SDR family oxidoreductase [Phycisphaerae bacterium]
MSDTPSIHSVMLTGATGFVGRSVVRSLLAHGLKPVCLVHSPERLLEQHPDVDPERLAAILGSLNDHGALREAASLSQAAIHLAGIILQRRLRGRTFQRVHVCGTRAVTEAVRRAGIKRMVFVSALGTRANASSAYHRSKWVAEECVRASGLDWTILRPSLIHGPDGAFMQLVKRLVCGLFPPAIPYFGDGRAKVQPVYVEDVAHCCVQSLFRDSAVGQVIPLGGPEAYSWVQLFNACRALMPGARRWKPLVSQPIPVAELSAMLSGPPLALAETIFPSLGVYRFDHGQVLMSQEDNVCDHTIAEEAFGIRMRHFEDELALYADLIR